MNQNDIKLAVMSANNTLATNNPKGLTQALKKNGYPVDPLFDILSYDELKKALADIYASDPKKWGEIMQSVPFNYEKTDSSTTQNTRTLFENITKSFNPYDNSNAMKSDKPKWWQTALNWIVGSTTTVHVGTPPPATKAPVWAYIGLTVVALSIISIVFFALRTKNI